MRQNLSDTIYSELKRRILNGTIPPGKDLPEKLLSEEFKVSRTPLREALNRLINEDLVVYRPNLGYTAATLSSAEFRHLEDLRRMVESRVASLAALRATPQEIKALRLAADMPPVEQGDDSSFSRFCLANARFHLLLVRATRNNLVENIVMSSLDQYQRPAYLGIGRVTDHEKPTRMHHDIVDALEDHDPFKAEVVMANHVIGGSKRIIKALEAEGY